MPTCYKRIKAHKLLNLSLFYKFRFYDAKKKLPVLAPEWWRGILRAQNQGIFHMRRCFCCMNGFFISVTQSWHARGPYTAG